VALTGKYREIGTGSIPAEFPAHHLQPAQRGWITSGFDESHLLYIRLGLHDLLGDARVKFPLNWRKYQGGNIPARGTFDLMKDSGFSFHWDKESV
jgi:hypothetical protein